MQIWRPGQRHFTATTINIHIRPVKKHSSLIRGIFLSLLSLFTEFQYSVTLLLEIDVF